MAGRQPNLVGYYSGWAQPFDTSFAETIHQHGVIPFVQIDPTDASVSAIASGTYDAYLRSYADSVTDFGHAVVIGFGHEMNASWYSWGYKHVPAATFVAAWRHIVTLFRGEGADNVTWLWTLEADQAGTGPVASWWPGAQYVTWVGIDGYYYRSSDTFASVFGQTIDQVRAFTSKPVLLSETAVGPDGRPVRQDPGPVPRDGHVQDARAGVVRQDPARRHLPPGLADRRQLVRPRFPSGWACVTRLTPNPSRRLGKTLACADRTHRIGQNSHTGNMRRQRAHWRSYGLTYHTGRHYASRFRISRKNQQTALLTVKANCTFS